MKKALFLAAVLAAVCIAGCGQSQSGSEQKAEATKPAAEETPAPAAAAEETTVPEVTPAEETAALETLPAVKEEAEEEKTGDADETAATDKKTQLADGFFTLYTRDGEHSVTFPSLGSIMNAESGSLSGQPDMLNPTGKTVEILNATYGTGTYEYDSGEFSSPEEYLAYKVPDESTVEAYYSEGYEEGQVVTAEINGYTVSSQRFAFTEYGKVRRFWHVALMTKADALLTFEFSEASDTDLLDEQLADDWYIALIEGMTENE